ncbi:hypothetical protein H2200_001278 [Cladophialophora chaetospira]|uniref:Uncharacterized protein n=1 Tax=Cladophialophora chaetospira TaxID=386627 RepID=A0AA39CNX1_9EURO|nr:hypothetical protein H2200_001278 [Cladophialophora chaetospira]
MPSLFTNEYSRGPLYQYWKERGAEERILRDQRVQEARIRSKGFTPMNAAYGPSSKESYTSRAERPPSYANELPSSTAEGSGRGSATTAPPISRLEAPSDGLPPYIDTTATSPTQNHFTNAISPTNDTLLSASEEKARLQRLEEQNQMSESDAAIAQTLSADEALENGDAEGKGKQPESKKSTVGKVGRWLADAASGYTKKQERW